MKSKRTQVERTATTRAALIGAARRLFAERGYGGVGTPEIAAAAGVTRGALYHQFAGKAALFLAVYEQVEQELAERIGARVAAAGVADPLDALTAGLDAFLDACAEPEVQRIALIEAPAVLGWETWREVGLRHGLGLTEAVLEAAIAAGRIAPQPVRPLAHVLIGALDEAALFIARAGRPGGGAGGDAGRPAGHGARARAHARRLAPGQRGGLEPAQRAGHEDRVGRVQVGERQAPLGRAGQRRGHAGQDAAVARRRVQRAVGRADDDARARGLEHEPVGVEQQRHRRGVVGLVGLEQPPVAELVRADARRARRRGAASRAPAGRSP